MLAQYQARVEAGLESLSFPISPANLYDPIRYVLKLGGKRMRPVLVLMANQMFEGNDQKALDAAMAVEVFHNFTLLHDDIMDMAPLRRGSDTVHQKWNSNVAILSGDAMFVKACQLMMQTSGSSHQYAMELFLKTALEVCEGQQLDMDFETTSRISIDDYLEMIRLKTAVLLGASLGIGATLAGASRSDTDHLYDFGVNLGVAFQLQDDILDVYGDELKFGKQVGGDILSNKKTFLLLSALKLADSVSLGELHYWMGREADAVDPSDKVKAVTAIYDRLNIRGIAEAKMDELYAAAEGHLEALPLRKDQTEPLRNLADFLMSRQS